MTRVATISAAFVIYLTLLCIIFSCQIQKSSGGSLTSLGLSKDYYYDSDEDAYDDAKILLNTNVQHQGMKLDTAEYDDDDTTLVASRTTPSNIHSEITNETNYMDVVTSQFGLFFSILGLVLSIFVFGILPLAGVAYCCYLRQRRNNNGADVNGNMMGSAKIPGNPQFVGQEALLPRDQKKEMQMSTSTTTLISRSHSFTVQGCFHTGYEHGNELAMCCKDCAVIRPYY